MLVCHCSVSSAVKVQCQPVDTAHRAVARLIQSRFLVLLGRLGQVLIKALVGVGLLGDFDGAL